MDLESFLRSRQSMHEKDRWEASIWDRFARSTGRASWDVEPGRVHLSEPDLIVHNEEKRIGVEITRILKRDLKAIESKEDQIARAVENHFSTITPPLYIHIYWSPWHRVPHQPEQRNKLRDRIIEMIEEYKPQAGMITELSSADEGLLDVLPAEVNSLRIHCWDFQDTTRVITPRSSFVSSLGLSEILERIRQKESKTYLGPYSELWLLIAAATSNGPSGFHEVDEVSLLSDKVSTRFDSIIAMDLTKVIKLRTSKT